uniref:GATA-type domain-containing protein n=1 Tax=Mycena chlorophos TaxID=658473 RepID=A0ABQ0LZ85_MYCCL|nr:predicted protein [Mycena chlorophos]
MVDVVQIQPDFQTMDGSLPEPCNLVYDDCPEMGRDIAITEKEYTASYAEYTNSWSPLDTTSNGAHSEKISPAFPVNETEDNLLFQPIRLESPTGEVVSDFEFQLGYGQEDDNWSPLDTTSSGADFEENSPEVFSTNGHEDNLLLQPTKEMTTDSNLHLQDEQEETQCPPSMDESSSHGAALVIDQEFLPTSSSQQTELNSSTEAGKPCRPVRTYCPNCGNPEPTGWRFGLISRKMICQACGQYEHRHKKLRKANFEERRRARRQAGGRR